jgi:3-oxoacyl-[acyl-carrier protein] reductase
VSGRVALVTGASRRCAIGAAIVRRLAADGFAVLIHSWEPHDLELHQVTDPGGAEALTAELRGQGARVEHVSADLADPEAPSALVADARDRFGRLDVLVANHARSRNQSLSELTAAELDLAFAVNARSTLLLIQALAAGWDRADGGRVVLFTSGQYHGAMPAELPYIAAKGALHQLTGSLAVELSPRGITVNCIDPGPTDTGYADAATLAAVASRIPGRRWGTPEDAARLVAWLVSDEAAWITGQVIASDGGWSAGPGGG